MEAYSSFAQVYDLFMDNVPYEEWSRYLISLLKEYQVTDGTVVELGCGTGKMTNSCEFHLNVTFFVICPLRFSCFSGIVAL